MGRRVFFILSLLIASLLGQAQKITPQGPVSFCAGGSVVLKAEGAESGAKFQWQKDGTDISGATNDNYTANATGNYKVKVSNRGDKIADTTYGPLKVTSNEYPNADFNFPSGQCGNLPVQFTNTSTGDKLTYLWNFGDGKTSTDKAPEHVYSPIGNGTKTYQITLIVTSAAGCKDTAKKTITVKEVPDATLNGSGFKNYNGESYFTICATGATGVFSFVNNSKTENTNKNYRIKWGDGSTDFTDTKFETSVKHTYGVGVNTLFFIVEGDNGCIDTSKYKVFLGTNPAVGLNNPGNTSVCTESTLTFPISGTEKNSPETVYTVSINDGSDPITFSHPPPPDFTHKFLISSCGTTSDDSKNSFKAKITATNPCLTSTAYIVPIYVSGQPKASLSTSSTVTCVDKLVTIKNTSPLFQNITGTECIGPSKVWKISPNNSGDWTVVSGTLGRDNGETDPNMWAEGSEELVIKFSKPGIYKITLITGNPNCGLATTTTEICVNPNPNPTITLDRNVGCGPLDVTATTSVQAATCGKYKYKWTVDYQPTAGCIPSTSNYKYLVGNDESPNPKFQFISPGIYTIGLVVSTEDGQCVSNKITKTITVKGKPVVNLLQIPTASICQNSSINPKTHVSCYIDNATKYNWSFNNGTPNTANTADPGTIIYNSAGQFNITLNVQNECGISTETAVIKVTPVPIITLPPNQNVCNGEKIKLPPFTATPASSISWKSSIDIGAGLSGTGSIPEFTAKNTGNNPVTATIVVTAKANDGGCEKSEQFTITINPTPAPPTGNNVSYCQNETASPLVATASSGHTLVWYAAASGGVPLPGAPTPSTATVGTQTYYVAQKNNTTQCESPRLAITVTIKAIPVIAKVITHNPTKCAAADGSLELTGLLPNTPYSVSYNGNTVTLTSNGSGIILITGLKAGAYTNITVNYNGCTSVPLGPFTLSDPNPPGKPIAKSNAPICTGNTLSLSTDAVVGAIYNWTGPNNFKSNLQNPTIPNATKAAEGVYTVTLTVAGCGSDGGTTTVVVNETPTVTIHSNSPICSGNELQLSSSTTFTGDLTYKWTGPNNFNSTERNPKITNAAANASGTYKLIITAKTGNCPSPEATTQVVVNLTPEIKNLNRTNPTNCKSATGTISFEVQSANTAFTVYYKQNGAAKTENLTSDANRIITIKNLPSGVYDEIYIESAEKCISNKFGPISLSDPNPPTTPTANSNSEICSGNDLKLTANTISGATYSWSGPNGFTSAIQNPTINKATVQASGIYSVTATVNGCTSAAGTTTVVVNETPTVTISSNSPICSGNELQLSSNTTFTGDLTYKWTGPNNFSSTEKNLKITNAPQNASGTYKLIITAKTGNCPSPEVATQVVVNLTPEIKNLNRTNPTNCKSSTGTISFEVQSANTAFTVYYKQDGVAKTENLTSDANSIITIKDLPAGTYSDIYIVSSEKCESNILGPISLSDPNPPDAPVAGSNSEICSGNDLKLTATSITGAIYSWSGPNNFTSTEQNPIISNATLQANGTYSVTATVNSCTSVAGTVTVIVNETPTVTISSNTPICSGNELQLSSSTTFSGDLTYKWTGPNNFSSTEKNPKITNAPQNASGTYKLIITATTGNCPSPEATTQVVVNLTPEIKNLNRTNPTNCKSSTGTISFEVQSGNTAFTVYYNQDGVAKTENLTSDANRIITIKDLPAGAYENIYIKSAADCQSNQLGPISLVDPNPPVKPVITGSAKICSGNEIQLKAQTSSPGVATYNWTGPNSFQSNTQQVIIKNAITAASGQYSVTATINNCISEARVFDVIVDSTPTAPKIISNSPVCSDKDINLDFTTDFPGVLTYKWTGPDNFNSDLKNPIIPSAGVKNGGIYKLVITSSEGCHSESTTNVIVHLTPVITVDFKNPQNCGKADGSITIHGLEKNTAYTVGYTKDSESPTILNNMMSNGVGDIKIDNLPQGDYHKIFVVLNDCPSNELTVSLHDPAPPVIQSITNNGPLCFGATLMLQSKTDPGVTYSWTGPNNFSSTEQNPMKTAVTLDDAGKYSLTITRNNCVTTDFTEVIINALPAPPIVADIEYCINTPSSPLTAIAGTGSILLWYSTATGGTGSTTAPTPNTSKDGLFSFFVSQKDGNGCESPRAEIKVTVHPDAIAEFIPTKIIDCPPFSITTQDIGLKVYPLNNKLYEWYVDGTNIGEGIDFPGYTIKNEDDTVTITLKAISLFGCKDAEQSHQFATFKLPHPSFEVSTDEGCGPLKVVFSNTTPDKSFFNHQWDFGNGITSKSADPGEITFDPNPNAGDTVYIVRLKTWNTCDTVIFEKTIRVKSRPIAIFTPSKTEGCSPMTVTFANTTKGKNVTYHWDFGDGTTYSTSTLEDVTHTFNTGTPTTFTVRLTATNECGSHFKEFKIVVSPNPIKLKFAMNGPDHFGCEPHTIVIYNNTAGASSFFWDFGDGNFLSTTKGVDSIQHTYLSPGDYKITVKASNNCTDTIAYDYVKVYPKPKAAFNANRYVACIGDEISFTNESQLATSYLWDFGDGITSTLSDPKHIYKTSGLFTVKLTVFKLNGPGSTCIETVEQKIQINDTMPGSFKTSTNIADCAPFTITFENDIKPSVTAVWDFGDGTSGSGDLVQHTYKSSGVYIVVLTITVPGGCTYISKQTITIKGPSGTFDYTSGYVCNSPVRFEATATGTDTYFWDFGDGQTQTTSNPVTYHTYSLPGNYVPTLVLKNNAGCNYPIKGIDTIKVDKIDVGFSTTDTRICELTTVHFTDTTHAYFGKTLIEWDFGDGQKGTGAQIDHQYKVSGMYTIGLKITGKSGCVETISRDIFVHVNNNPTVIITADKTGCNNQEVKFDASILSDDPINTIEWKISNGVTGTGKSFNYLFQTPGTYTVTWTVGTVNGCYGTATHTITINPAPTVTANADLILCLGNSVQLNAYGGNTYQWSPLEGLSCTTCDNPVATPTKTTPYVVAGYNNFGCVDRDTVYVTVIPPLKLTTSGNDSICIGQSANLLVSGAASYWWTPAEGLSSTSISNPVANPVITTKYRVIGYDGHGCFSDTAYIVVGVGDYPTVDLGPDQTLSTGTIFPLKSTITNGPIKDWLWKPSTNLDCDDCPEPKAHIKKEITYSVEVTSIYGCKASDTINIKVFCENTQVFIPNAFTPDGDGVNDILMVRGTGIVTVKSFRIFNRWGVLVFEKNNFPPNEPSFGWDGKINGKVGPSEVFVYTAEVICENGTIYTYKGNTTILK